MAKAHKIIGVTVISVSFLMIFNHFNGSMRRHNISAMDRNNSNYKPYSLTPTQQNAFREAKSYLDSNSFSRIGLIHQLDSDIVGFSKEDATVAVNALKVDWKEQAVKEAHSYLDIQGFSCKALVEQLSSPYSDNYSMDEASYAAKKVGVCPSNMIFNSKGLEDVIDIHSGTGDKVRAFIDAGGLNSHNNFFHGLYVDYYSLKVENKEKIISVDILTDDSSSLDDVLSNMGSYCEIAKWNRVHDDYAYDIHIGEGYGKNCDAIYRKMSHGFSITYALPGYLQH
ncbi:MULTISPECIES: Ltp family lipoprotein [unclassified Saccharibacter]|uniref:Ltp family lipoprotein n=1 Tax=unclassified Saccharibacter TaxID=2648722 RepID=UPI001324EA31|nr:MULTISPECIES: Ltp family lipoprotein [unclassified Saccharibacter]MXV36588.1 hypothetical protein [Saccharibacter sp. EH611]MXV57750.1 hypothetical protein [Saccharibacter sp. EH70]MXV64943.1 hypothetical protein [Saccharibacter sp. EH60]